MKVIVPLALALLFAVSCPAQFLSLSGGALRTESRQPALSADTSWIVAADGGVPVFPFVAVAVHYSYARTPFSTASPFFTGNFELPQHNLAIEGRLRTPSLLGWRLYGFAGPGLSRFSPTSNGSDTKAMFTYGGGVERGVFPLVRLKFEVRDYVTDTLDSLNMSGGAWHRTAFLGGVVLGR